MRKALTDTGYRYFFKDTVSDTIESPVFTSLRDAAEWEADYRKRVEGAREALSVLIDGVISLTEDAPADYVLTREELGFITSLVIRLEGGEELESEAQCRLGRVMGIIELIFAFSQQEDLYDEGALLSMFRDASVSFKEPFDADSELDSLHSRVYKSALTREELRRDGLLSPELERLTRPKASTREERILIGRILRTQLQLAKNLASAGWKDVFAELNLNIALA